MDTMEMFKHLDDAEKEAYIRLQKVFDQPGWKDIIDEATREISDLERTAMYASNWEANRIAIGAIGSLERLIGYEQSTNNRFEGLAEDRASESKDTVDDLEAIE